MAQSIYKEDLVPLSPLYRVQTDFITMGTTVNRSDHFNNKGAVSALSAQLINEVSQYSSTVKDASEKAILSQTTTDIVDYETEIDQALGYFVTGDLKPAYELINTKLTTTPAHFDKLITRLFTKKISEAKQRNEQSQRDFTTSMSIMALVTLISIVLAALLGRLDAKLICKPINSLVKSAEEISEGNLDVEISSEYKGDFVKIKDSINHIIATFNDVISEIIFAASDITENSKQL